MPNINDKIADILRKYFEYDDNGNPNDNYDPNYSAEDAIDDIHELIGKI